MLLVCAAIIRKGDKILIAQRGKGGTSAYEWEFPGGKIEEGEGPEECIIREIREELDIEIKVDRVFDVIHHRYPDREILLLVYSCIYQSGNPKALECNDFMWININETSQYKFSEADKEIVKKLIKL